MDDLKHIIKLLNEQGKKLSKIEKLLVSKQNKVSGHLTTNKFSSDMMASKKIPEKIIGLIAKNLDELQIALLVLLALKFHNSLTKSQQKIILEGWGKKVGENLNGGNYQRDLVSKGLVHEMGKSGTESVYELTARGKIEADKIINKLEMNSIGKK